MLETAATLAFLSLPAMPVPEPRNPDRRYHEIIAAKKVSDLSVNAFVEAEQAFGSYVKKNRRFPEHLGDIFPSYGFKPPLPEGMAWSYGKGSTRNGWFFCMHGAAPDLFAKSFGRTKKMFEGHDAYFANQCGAVTSNSDFAPRTGAPVAITYWVATETDQTVELPVVISCKNRKEEICKKQPIVKDGIKKPNKPKKPKKPKK